MYDLLIFRRWFAILALLLAPLTVLGAAGGSVHGTVTDPLGAVVVSATVELLEGTTVAQSTVTDANGNYTFHLEKTAHYQVRAVAPTFQSTTSNLIFVTATAQVDITLSTQTL